MGSDADVIVWDPAASSTISAQTHQSRCDFNIFEDMSCRGLPRYVISRGAVVVDPAGVCMHVLSYEYFSVIVTKYLYCAPDTNTNPEVLVVVAIVVKYVFSAYIRT